MPQQQYWCFISYRHVDNTEEKGGWATWLHQAIETYEVPKDLVGTENERGELIPERIFPVFRDEEELPTGNLTTGICDALDSAKTLVVLCSPDVIESTHVSDEIKYFKQLHPTDHSDLIHPALLEGDPNANDGSTDACFPEVLKYDLIDGEVDKTKPVELLAADFRLDGKRGWTIPSFHRDSLKLNTPEIDSKELANLVSEYQAQLHDSLLQLIAGILGVGLDDLRKRDKVYQLELERQRTVKLRRWLTAVGSLLIIIVLSLAAVVFQWFQLQSAAELRDAERTLDLAIAEFDEEPAESIYASLEALAVIEQRSPESITETLSRIDKLLKSGRLDRFGENVQEFFATDDGSRVVVLHENEVVEFFDLDTTTPILQIPNVYSVSEAWGPNFHWHTLETNNGLILLDKRQGHQILDRDYGEYIGKAFPPISQISQFKEPSTIDHWSIFAPYNHPSAFCSVAFSMCWVQSIDDHAEWAAVDSWTVNLNLSSGDVSRPHSNEIYELYGGHNLNFPCQVTRENGGYFLSTPHNNVNLGDKYSVKDSYFSSLGTFVIVELDSELAIYSCTSGERKYSISKENGVVVKFSADDTHLLIATPKKVEILETHSFETKGNSINISADNRSIEAIRNSSSAWKIVNADGQMKTIFLTKDTIYDQFDVVDHRLQMVVKQGEPWSFRNLVTGQVVTADSGELVESTDADLFVTYKHADYSYNDKTVIESLAVRKLDKPHDVIWESEPVPEYGEWRFRFKHTDELGIVTEFIREDSGDPPFQNRYYHNTTVFDLRTSASVASLGFEVTSVRKVVAGKFTELVGQDNERADFRAVLNNEKRTLIWVGSEQQINAIYFDENPKASVFVVAYGREGGSVRSLSNGSQIGTLTNMVTKIDFAPQGTNLFLATYANGLSEVWSFDQTSAKKLVDLGLIVKEVVYLPKRDKMLVQYEDGRLYLIDLNWLQKIDKEQLSTAEIVNLFQSGEGFLAPNNSVREQ